MYKINERLLSKYNRPKQPLNPKGFVIHSTSNEGATAENHYNYWNNEDRESSAHYVIDWNEIIRLIPENEIAWHAGNNRANGTYLSAEMCEPRGYNMEQFNEVWRRTVWLVADSCVNHGWSTGPNVWSHNGLRSLYPGIDHTDPYGFFKKYGKSWSDMINDIDAEIARMKNAPEASEPVSDPDMYLTVKVRRSKADALIKEIIGMGYATKKLELP
ncbi:MAG: N-acetylmuramoyl-L-alanine amidase family protein [Desulfitobacterium sp.]